MSFSWLGTATFIAKHIARSPGHVARELSNVSTVRPKFPMLTINQILGPYGVQSETTLWWRTLCLISKKVGGKKEKERFYYIYLLVNVKKILAVTDATYAVAKRKPEKIRLAGI